MNGFIERSLTISYCALGVLTFMLVICLIIPFGILSFFEWWLTGTDYILQPIYGLMSYTEDHIEI